MVNQNFYEDIQQIISNKKIPWQNMANSTVFITGVTGLIGSSIVFVLRAAEEKYGLRLRIIGSSRHTPESKLLTPSSGLDEFICHDIRQPFFQDNLTSQLDFIFHCAAMTQSSDMVLKPVDVITTAVNGTWNALELAYAKKCKSFVYLSSMEVYGQTSLSEVKESDLGYWDLSRSRSCYPESKRLCENLCAAYGAQYGMPIKIARLSLTFGAGIPRDSADSRVPMQFARKAISGEDIELHTEGKSVINCCYTADTVSGLLTILLKGINGEAYNIANPNVSVTVREMAELVANEAFGRNIKVVTRIPEGIQKYRYAPDCGYVINVDKLIELGWQPQYSLAEMYNRMMADWEDIEIAESTTKAYH